MSFEKVPNFLVNFSDVEMRSNEAVSYTFNSFLLDVEERQLFRDDRSVSLTPKAFDVLVYLVANGGHLVLKEDLMQAVWPDSFVDEVNLPRTIHTLRRALGEDENGSKFIETVPTKGYRFVAKVDEVPESPTAYSGDSVLPYDETDGQTTAKPKQKTRLVLLTLGFAGAIVLIFLLSFELRSRYFGRSNGVRSIAETRYTSNEEAYRLYLQGSALADKLTPDGSKKAIEAFEQAIKLDPNYAPAYARLANNHTAIAFMGVGGTPFEEYLKAKDAVEKAVAIDDNLAEAHAYLGEIKTNFEWNFAEAEREDKRAVELDPNSAAAHRMYALLLGFLGRSDESIVEAKTAIDLEPAAVLNHKIYQQNLFYARRYDEAIAEGKRTLEIDAGFLGVFDTVIGSYLMKGENDQAFDWFLRQCDLKKNSPYEIDGWKTIYGQSGWAGIRTRQLDQAKDAERNGDPNPMTLARLYTTTGDQDQAFVYLERAFVKRWQGMNALNVSPNFDALRGDPRFDDLIRRVGLK